FGRSELDFGGFQLPMLDAFLTHHSQRLTDVPGNVQRVLHRNRSTLDGPGQRSVSLLTPFHMPGKPRNRNLERRGMFRIPTFRIADYASTVASLLRCQTVSGGRAPAVDDIGLPGNGGLHDA